MNYSQAWQGVCALSAVELSEKRSKSEDLSEGTSEWKGGEVHDLEKGEYLKFNSRRCNMPKMGQLQKV